MEVHAVLPEERARDEKGNILPWGYRFMDPSRNPRLPSEESGPFGKNRTARYTGSRSRTRTGTTPVRQKENPAVAEFGKILAQGQKDEEERQSKAALPTNTSGDAPKQLAAPEAVATECLLYGYSSKAAEWKVLSKFERIVSPSYICEDYSRDDPDLALTAFNAFSSSELVLHRDLSSDALRKSRVYQGGNHWIKVTFDNHQAAERACFYSPQEIDGHLVFCEMWHGRPPFSDCPLVKGSRTANEHQRNANAKLRTLITSQPTQYAPSGVESAVSGFERAAQTLPRSFTAQDVQYGRPQSPSSPSQTRDDVLHPPSSQSSNTASSATATALDRPHPTDPFNQSSLRSRSTPSLPTAPKQPPASSEYMSQIPSIRKARLRPISEALLPQPTLAQRILRHIPILSWLAGPVVMPPTSDSSSTKPENPNSTNNGPGQDWIDDGPVLTEDGKWDPDRNGWYWSFWWQLDQMCGTDYCGLRED